MRIATISNWFLGAVLLMIGPVWADSKFSMEEISVVGSLESDSAPKETREEYTLWMRADRAARVSEGMRIIVRLDLGETYVVNDAGKTVTVIPFDTLPDVAATAPQITKTGESQVINGWNAERYDLTLADEALNGTIVLWISNEVDVDMEPYRAYSKSLDGGLGLLTAIAALPGYPVLTETDLGIVKSTGRLISVTVEEAPDGIYEVPVNYERN